MPDLITHTAVASFLADKKYRYVFFLLLGAMLPDVTRLVFILFPDNYQAYWFFTGMHTPFTCLLLAILVVQFFAKDLRRPALGWITLGLATHFVLDALQLHFGSFAYPWLFPFSMVGTDWGLFWPEDPLYVAPALAVLAVIWYYLRRRNLTKNIHERQSDTNQ